MVRVKNAHTAAVILKVGDVGPVEIGAGSEVLISNDDWKTLNEHPAVRGRVSDGSLVVASVEKFTHEATDETPADDAADDETSAPKRKARAKARARK